MNKNLLTQYTDQPFTLFFPMGIVMGFIYLGCWLIFAAIDGSPYPGTFHAFGIISLFIGSFAIGFMLTAIPRFTATEKASAFEIFTLFIISILEMLSMLILFATPAFAVFTLAKLSFLLIFVFRRVLKSDFPIPASFSWVLLGVASGFLGILGVTFINILPSLEGQINLFKSLFLRGFLTGLLMGIGGRLVPFLTNIGDGVTKSESSKTIHTLCSIVFYISLILENTHYEYGQALLFIQSLVLLFEIVFVWKLYKLPASGARSIGLWVASWNVVLGLVLSSLFYTYKIHFMHLTFVGGFAMATLAVASHVKVAHLNFNQKKLIKFWPLGLILILTWLASLTRVIAPFSSYLNHLAYSALCLSIALAIWSFTFRKS